MEKIRALNEIASVAGVVARVSFTCLDLRDRGSPSTLMARQCRAARKTRSERSGTSTSPGLAKDIDAPRTESGINLWASPAADVAAVSLLPRWTANDAVVGPRIGEFGSGPLRC